MWPWNTLKFNELNATVASLKPVAIVIHSAWWRYFLKGKNQGSNSLECVGMTARVRARKRDGLRTKSKLRALGNTLLRKPSECADLIFSFICNIVQGNRVPSKHFQLYPFILQTIHWKHTHRHPQGTHNYKFVSEITLLFSQDVEWEGLFCTELQLRFKAPDKTVKYPSVPRQLLFNS